MMTLNTIAAVAKLYVYEGATAAKDAKNGVCGNVADGKFTQAAGGKYALMQVETGDNADTADYKIAAGDKVRVANLTKLADKDVQIYDAITGDVTVGAVVTFGDDGYAVAAAAPTTAGAVYFVVVKKLYAGGAFAGVVATVKIVA